MGLMPEYKNYFAGVRYHYAQYHTQLVNDPSQFSTNYYNTIELWGGAHIGKRFQVMGFIPYYQNKQVDDDGTSKPNGLGDITVIGQYQVFHFMNMNAKKKMVDQQLWLGGGVKLATGTFDTGVDSTTTVADINAQLGTGSTDFLLNGLYSIRVGNFGVNASATYKINTTNKDDYRYGNKFNGIAIAYYRFNAKKLSISPNIGAAYEHVAANTLNSKNVQYTGSNVTTAQAGVEFSIKGIGFGLNAQLPVAQSFAEGQTEMKVKGMAHITFAL
jgi:hypothetical protein